MIIESGGKIISIDYDLDFCNSCNYAPCKDGIPIYEDTNYILVDTYNLNGFFNMTLEITEDFFKWVYCNPHGKFILGYSSSYKFDVSEYEIKGIRIRYINKRTNLDIIPKNKVRIEIEKR